MSARKVPVDLDELINAFDTHLLEAQYFLDLETGDVILVSDEAKSIAEDLVQSIPEEEDVTREALQAAAEDSDEQDWGTRYVEVPSVESRTGYQDMEDFIATVADPVLQRTLERVIIGRGAFRRFKDLLADYPEERERWFAFQDDITRRRVLAWLDEQGIEPVPRPKTQQR